MNENLTDNNGRNTVSSVGSLEFPKKYRHVYRGMVYYDDKPNPNDKKNSNNNRDKNKNKKNIQDDDEIDLKQKIKYYKILSNKDNENIINFLTKKENKNKNDNNKNEIHNEKN